MGDRKRTRVACQRCGRGIPPRRGGTPYCSDKCEVAQGAEDRWSAENEKAAQPEVKKAYYDNPVMIDGIPRNARVDHWTAAEVAISDAIDAVESGGAHPLMTDAVILLGDAQRKVAEYVDRQIQSGDPSHVR
jgi:endogenous inhibitor of DNA gyrase (YacG/DUF329 family)